MAEPAPQPGPRADTQDYQWKLDREAEFWGVMARERWKGGIPMTMDFRRATRYRVSREALGWCDYFQDPALESLTPFGRARIRFVRRAGNDPGEEALDLCCGAGWLALELARAGKQVDAVDISRPEIDVAREYQATLEEDLPGHINWIVADLNTFTTEENRYDQVTAWDGLHHIENVDHLCSTIDRALKPGGRFFFAERIWGGENPSLRARLGRYLEQLLWTLVPTPSPFNYRRKFGELFRSWKGLFRSKILRQKIEQQPWQIKEKGFCSPFEDASGGEIMAGVQRYFEIEATEDYGGFSEDILRTLYLPRVLRWPAVLLLGWLDHLVVKIGLLEGKITLVYARKRNREHH
jgi:2-polyprenyl-3-methyl-5-hydroxy-6-metoxy-1,4-benzoquinol methylase